MKTYDTAFIPKHKTEEIGAFTANGFKPVGMAYDEKEKCAVVLLIREKPEHDGYSEVEGFKARSEQQMLYCPDFVEFDPEDGSNEELHGYCCHSALCITEMYERDLMGFKKGVNTSYINLCTGMVKTKNRKAVE